MSAFPKDFGGIVPPLSTPLTESYEVDVQSLQRLIEFQLDAGVHGLFVLGTTSEMAFLTNAQRETVINVTVKTVAGRVPVLAGVIDMTTARVLAHARIAQSAGVDGLVVTAPFYTRTSPQEIIEHFRILHAAIDLPILAYDIPMAVHSKLASETVLQMAREKLIIGVKDSSGDEANFRDHGVVTMPDFLVFTGSELVADTALFTGASGVVPGLGNVDPHGYTRLYQSARNGDWQTVRQEQERLYRLFKIFLCGSGRMELVPQP